MGKVLKFENHRFKRGAVLFFFLAESKLEALDVNTFSLKKQPSRKGLVSRLDT